MNDMAAPKTRLENFTGCDCLCHQGLFVHGRVLHVVPCCGSPGRSKLKMGFARKIVRRLKKKSR